MKLKTLLYGTAAILVSTGATNVALAADPPDAAAPVDYVRICDAFGTGFFYIPGTDTCLRIGGYVRIEYRIRDDQNNQNRDVYRTRARYRVNLDARTETDLGLLRTFIRFYQTLGPGGTNPSNFDYEYSSPLEFDEAFITLGTETGQWTFGKTGSFFDFWGGQTFTGVGGFDPTNDATMLAYTFNLGNGVSASLSFEDPYAEGRKINVGGAAGGSVQIYGGQDFPDLVANINVDQGWGEAQVMVALREMVEKTGFGANPDDLGWAVGAGVEVSAFGPATFFLTGAYTEGMTAYVSPNAPFLLTDSFAGINTEAWQVGAGVTVAVAPTVDINIDGAYGEVDYNLIAADHDYWGIAGNVVWNPVGGFIIGAEVLYTESSASSVLDTCVAAGAATCDADTWSARVRVQRTF